MLSVDSPSMKENQFNVVVYSASSASVDKVYIDAATQLGKLLAQNKMTCINGGGNLGLMKAVIDAVLQQGGQVKGVIPQFMVDSGWCHPELIDKNQIVTNTMHERKQKMADISDAVIALPGGVGTLEELLEIITWKQLGLYKHPIIILNINNYYDSLLKMFDTMLNQQFLHERYKEMWKVVTTPQEAIEELSKDSVNFSHLLKFETKS